jgi:hypothetical protein
VVKVTEPFPPAAAGRGIVGRAYGNWTVQILLRFRSSSLPSWQSRPDQDGQQRFGPVS